jgi:hypothetical protein
MNGNDKLVTVKFHITECMRKFNLQGNLLLFHRGDDTKIYHYNSHFKNNFINKSASESAQNCR